VRVSFRRSRAFCQRDLPISQSTAHGTARPRDQSPLREGMLPPSVFVRPPYGVGYPGCPCENGVSERVLKPGEAQRSLLRAPPSPVACLPARDQRVFARVEHDGHSGEAAAGILELRVSRGGSAETCASRGSGHGLAGAQAGLEPAPSG
jgi:hypothetical protein